MDIMARPDNKSLMYAHWRMFKKKITDHSKHRSAAKEFIKLVESFHKGKLYFGHSESRRHTEAADRRFCRIVEKMAK